MNKRYLISLGLFKKWSIFTPILTSIRERECVRLWSQLFQHSYVLHIYKINVWCSLNTPERRWCFVAYDVMWNCTIMLCFQLNSVIKFISHRCHNTCSPDGQDIGFLRELMFHKQLQQWEMSWCKKDKDEGYGALDAWFSALLFWLRTLSYVKFSENDCCVHGSSFWRHLSSFPRLLSSDDCGDQAPPLPWSLTTGDHPWECLWEPPPPRPGSSGPPSVVSRLSSRKLLPPLE